MKSFQEREDLFCIGSVSSASSSVRLSNLSRARPVFCSEGRFNRMRNSYSEAAASPSETESRERGQTYSGERESREMSLRMNCQLVLSLSSPREERRMFLSVESRGESAR